MELDKDREQQNQDAASAPDIGSKDEGEQAPIETYTCASCGKILSLEKFPAGTECPYCGSRKRITDEGKLMKGRRLSPNLIAFIICSIVVILCAIILFIRTRPIIEPALDVDKAPQGVEELQPPPSNDSAIQTQAAGDSERETEESLQARVAEPLAEPSRPLQAAEQRQAALPPRGLHALYMRPLTLEDAFDDVVVDPGLWQPEPAAAQSDCTLAFGEENGRLHGRSSTKAGESASAIEAKTLLSGDFDVTLDFEWIAQPAQGDAGCYIEFADAQSGAVASLGLHAWGPGHGERNILFRYTEGESNKGRETASSSESRASGRIRVQRKGGDFETAYWDNTWQPIGAAQGFASPARLRMRLYAGTGCPKFDLALDNLTAAYTREFLHVAEEATGAENREMTLVGAKGGPILVIENGEVVEVAAEEIDLLNLPARSDVRLQPQLRGTASEQRPRRSDESSTPREAKLPHSMVFLKQGPNVIRLENRAEATVRVGVRSEGRGKDLRLGQGAARSIRVPDGTYDIYFIRTDEPEILLRGASFRFGPAGRTIAIQLLDGS